MGYPTTADVRGTLDGLPLTEQGRAYVASWSLPERKTIGFASWFRGNHGRNVETLQVGRDGSHPWAPGPRVVDSQRRGNAVILHDVDDQHRGSWRYYAGMHVIVSDSRTLVAADDSQLVLYRVLD